MIEKKYTGIAKQGADVVANPTLDGSEQALNSIQINGENFKIEGEKEQYRLENVQLIFESGQISIDVPTLKKNKIYHFHMNTSMGYNANFNFYIDEYGVSFENIGFYYDIDQNVTICNLYYEENDFTTNKPIIKINAYEDVELLEETADYIIISEV